MDTPEANSAGADDATHEGTEVNGTHEIAAVQPGALIISSAKNANVKAPVGLVAVTMPGELVPL